LHLQQFSCFLLLFVIGFLVDLALLHQPIAEVHVGVRALADGVASFEHLADGGKEDLDIDEEGDLFYVLEVVLKFFFPGDVVPAVDLGKSREPRAHAVAAALLGGHEGHIADELGARSDDRHVSYENVKELGQLVERGGAEKLTVLVETHGVGEEVAVFILFVAHGAELDELENFFFSRFFADPSRTKLGEEGVAAHGDGTDDRE